MPTAFFDITMELPVIRTTRQGPEIAKIQTIARRQLPSCNSQSMRVSDASLQAV